MELRTKTELAGRIVDKVPEPKNEYIKNWVLKEFKDIEIEARLVRINEKTRSRTLTKEDYDRLKYMLSSQNEIVPEILKYETYMDYGTDIRCDSKTKKCIRKIKFDIIDFEITYPRQEQESSTEPPQLSFRISYSNELDMPNIQYSKTGYKRTINRISYVTNDFRYDLSEVESWDKKLKKLIKNYEFEIEFIPKDKKLRPFGNELENKIMKFASYLHKSDLTTFELVDLR